MFAAVEDICDLGSTRMISSNVCCISYVNLLGRDRLGKGCIERRHKLYGCMRGEEKGSSDVRPARHEAEAMLTGISRALIRARQ
jgi:hypothetical protein